jgi:hypothetical protein
MMSSDVRLTPVDKISQRKPAHLTLIGGGAANLIALQHIVGQYQRHLSENPSDPTPLMITWIDRHGSQGQGGDGVYDHFNAVFSLNQPVGRMGLTYPEQLTDWLAVQQSTKAPEDIDRADKKIVTLLSQGKNREQIRLEAPNDFIMASHFGPHDYIPRALLGYFLRDCFHAVQGQIQGINAQYFCSDLKNLITLNVAEANVTEASLSADGGICFSGTRQTLQQDLLSPEDKPRAPVRTEDLTPWGSSYSSDSAIIATGHRHNGILAKFKDHAGYADTPFRMSEVAQAVEKAMQDERPIFVAGTGQAFMDFVGAARALDYQGKIFAASGDLIEPWPRDHKKCPVPHTEYQFHCFTPDTISRILAECAQDTPRAIRELRAIIQQEMHCEQALNADPQCVIHTFQTVCTETFVPLFHGCDSKIYDSVLDCFKSQDGNSTLPDRYETYCHLKNTRLADGSPQLELIQGRVDTSASSVNSDGTFNVVITQADGGTKTFHVAAVINTASINRDPMGSDGKFSAPLQNSLHQLGLASYDRSTRMIVGTSGDNDSPPDVFVAFTGAGAGGGFGVPNIRDQIKTQASAALNRALIRAERRLIS